MLSEAQVAHYQENGFVIPDYRLSEETLSAIRDDHDRLLRRHPEFHNYCPQLLAWEFWSVNLIYIVRSCMLRIDFER